MTDVTKGLLDALKGLLVRVADDEEYGPDHAVTVARAAVARAEAALAEPKPDADGWIPWAGFQIPIQDGVAHQVEFRDGEVSEVDFEASGWSQWHHDGSDSDIVRYRIAKESGK